MIEFRYRLSSTVTVLFALTAFILPSQAGAQMSSRAARTSSSAVANQADSIPALLARSGSVPADSGIGSDKVLYSPSGDKGSGLSGKVFARFVMPEDWISLSSLPGAQMASTSVQTPGVETVFTMRSFGQKVRAWLNGYRLGYWPQ